MKKNKLAEENPCIDITPVVVIDNKLMELNNGQGEGLTKWNGWAWKTLLIFKDIFFYYFVSEPLFFIKDKLKIVNEFTSLSSFLFLSF